jgi:copper resistance protein C
MRLRAFLTVLAVLTGLVLGTATAAQAHTALQSSSPADGSTLTAPQPAVELTFTGQVLLREVTVTGPSGASAATGPAGAAGAVISQPVTLGAAGTYTVAYAVTSGDGHVLEGTLAFTYAPPAPPTPAGAAPSSASAPGSPATSAPVEPRAAAAERPAAQPAGLPGWVPWVVAVAVLAAAALLLLLRRRTRR